MKLHGGRAIRAASDVARDSEVIVFGSQAILGRFPNTHDDLRQSAEAGDWRS
ncbi:MAG: hypothetical protein M3R07_05205 [Gemmatimonadota bacterium]|nr:hypothetical protein [Gemmatimonadota bacterium]